MKPKTLKQNGNGGHEEGMTGYTDEYGNRILDLPDEEESDVLDSEPKLVYFPDEGNFQLSGIDSVGYTNITQRQARQMVEFINQVLEWDHSVPSPELKRMFSDVRKAIDERYGKGGEDLDNLAYCCGLDDVQPIRDATADIQGFTHAGIGLVMNLLESLDLDIGDYV